MDRSQISRIAHTRHPVAAPLADTSVERVVAALELTPAASVLDLGCGEGRWLHHVAERYRCACRGVDVDAAAIENGRRGAPSGVELEVADAADAVRAQGDGSLDALLCVGSTHALGGLDGVLGQASRVVVDGGALLLGEGFWHTEPTAEALRGLGAERDDLPHLDALVSKVAAAGFVLTLLHTSSEQEWDAYETSWSGSLHEHARRLHDADEAAALRSAADEHARGYFRGYRGVLGFATLVARRWR